MTPKTPEQNGPGHRRAHGSNDEPVQPAAPNEIDADALEDDELLAAALFTEDALSDEMLIGSPAELDALDDLDDLDDDTVLDIVSAARARITVVELLDHLINHPEDVALRDLFVLSDISRAEAEAVSTQWGAIPVERRVRLIRALVSSAEEHVDLLLGRLLRIALRDSDAGVRRLAIDGLWEETDPALIGPFVQMLSSDPNPGVRAAAAAALGPFVLAGELDELDAAMSMRAEQALLAIIQNKDEPVAVQAKALESVAYSGEAGLRQLIEDAYYAPEEELRLSALRAMGRSADTHWRALVRAELTSPDAAMRAEAALAAGELEIKAATPRIISMLEDDELVVRLAAIDALGHLGGKAAREALRRIADEAEDDEAEAAEIALDEMLFYDEIGAVPLLDTEDAEGADDMIDFGDLNDLDAVDDLDDLEDLEDRADRAYPDKAARRTPVNADDDEDDDDTDDEDDDDDGESEPWLRKRGDD